MVFFRSLFINPLFTISLALILGILYLFSFIVHAEYNIDVNNFLGVLFTAAPTIPILFLFSLLIPNIIVYKKRQESLIREITLALLISLSVFLSASYLFGIDKQGAIFLTIPSFLGGLLLFLYYSDLQFILRLAIGLLLSLLINPMIGINVAYSYLNLKEQFGSAYRIRFDFIDVTLLIFTFLIVFLKFRKVSVFLNILFVGVIVLFLLISGSLSNIVIQPRY